LDGAVSGDDLFTESNTFTIEVAPVNDEPMITRVGPYETAGLEEIVFEDAMGAFEDKWFNITIQVSDMDLETGGDDEITFDIDTTGIRIVLAGGTGPDLNLSYLPANEDVGWKNFTLNIDDNSGGTDSIDISILTANTNDVPDFEFFIQGGKAIPPDNGTLELTGTSGAMEDEWFNFTMSAVDDDMDIIEEELMFTSNSTLTYFNIEPTTGDVSFYPLNENVGMVEIFITVTDNEGASNTVKILLEVININDQPVYPDIILEEERHVYYVGEYVNLTCEYFDEDLLVDPTETVTVTWTSSLDGALGTGDTLSINSLSKGDHYITATVTDAGGLSTNEEVFIMITEPSDIPEPSDPDPNATTGEKKVEKEGAPIGLIIFIIIIALALLAGVVVLFLLVFKRSEGGSEGKGADEEVNESKPDIEEDIPNINEDPNITNGM
jgi:hypothetical protein